MKRIKWLDFAKGITILCVVLIHTLPYGKNYFLSYLFDILKILAMPIFFAISGYLFKRTNTWNKYRVMLYKKASGFIIPYVVFTFVILMGYKLRYGTSIIFNLYHLYSSPLVYLWFLYSLFFIFLIIGLLDLFNVNLYMQLGISVICMFAQMFLPWQINEGQINPIAGIGGYMICFSLGRVLRKINFVKFFKYNRVIYGFFISWLLLSIAQIYITGLTYETDLFNWGDFVTKILSIPVFFLIFSHWHYSKLFTYFDKYGKYTLIIYLSQHPITINLYALLLKCSIKNTIILFLITSICSWYLSIVVCYIAKNFKIIDFIFYPKKYIDKLFMYI